MEARQEQIGNGRSGHRERELVLAPNEYAFVQDTTKGHVNCYVGPNKTSLAGTDLLVDFNERSKQFGEVSTMNQAVHPWKTAPEGWYIVLKNPAMENSHPGPGMSSANSPELQIGRKIIVPGPASFALWPGQMAKVVQGHTMRSNQYLKARAYEPEAARAGWSDAMGGADIETPDFTAGEIIIIKGTDISFFMPPTGIEVEPDDKGNYVRDALSLQRLEYCRLKDENGTIQYVRGEAVVFPKPTQRFIKDEVGQIKHKAIELSPIKGLHVKVSAPYEDENGKHTEGEELFIKGKDLIYFPRSEHTLVTYGDSDFVHSVAVPKGEARYVLNRDTGDIMTVQGPCMLMPDPRNQVIVRRVLSDQQCSLLYPGNQDAVVFNRKLRDVKTVTSAKHFLSAGVDAAPVMSATISESLERGISPDDTYQARKAVKEGFAGDNFDRGASYQPPRSITLDTKFDGAVRTDIWPGYAVQVVNQIGERRVIEGPAAVILQYDEFPEVLVLSTGKPKNNNSNLKRTPFLQTQGNKVTDLVELVTKDLVRCKLKVKYRVHFEGENKDIWFAVSNYVQLLCDHANSRLKGAARQETIQNLRNNLTPLVRKVILGEKEEGEGARPGMRFAENGMRVFDVEVLEMTIDDELVDNMMQSAQRNAVEQEIELERAQTNLRVSTQQIKIERELAQQRAETEKLRLELQQARDEQQHEVATVKHQQDHAFRTQQKTDECRVAEISHNIKEQILATSKMTDDANMANRTALQTLNIERLTAQVTATVETGKAFSPQLIEALQRLGDQELMGKLSENFGELAAVEGQGILKVAQRFLDFVPNSVIPQMRDIKRDGDQATLSPADA